MAFADLEARLNASVFAHLADESATLDGVAVTGIFDNPSAISQGGVGMVSTEPTYTMLTSAVPATPEGKTLVINSTTYTIVEHQPDGTGVSVLTLELA